MVDVAIGLEVRGEAAPRPGGDPRPPEQGARQRREVAAVADHPPVGGSRRAQRRGIEPPDELDHRRRGARLDLVRPCGWDLDAVPVGPELVEDQALHDRPQRERVFGQLFERVGPGIEGRHRAGGRVVRKLVVSHLSMRQPSVA